MNPAAASLLVATAGLSVGCDELQQLVPSVRFDTLRTTDIDFEHIDAEFVFQVDNPNPVGVDLASFSYALELEGVALLDGDEPGGLELEPLGSAEVSLPTSLVWANVFEAVQATRGEDEVDFGLAGAFGFDTRWGPVELPYQTDGRFPALRTPRFSLGTLRVGSVDIPRGTATVVLDLRVDNDHGSALDFADLDYSLSLAGRDVADGLIPDLGAVPGATESLVEVPVTVDLVAAGATVVDALTRGGRLDVGLDANVDVDTPFGALPLAIDETGNVSVQR